MEATIMGLRLQGGRVVACVWFRVSGLGVSIVLRARDH